MDHQSFCFSNLEEELHKSFARVPQHVDVTAQNSILQELDMYCETTTDDNTKPLVIVSDVGLGKSTLLASWLSKKDDAVQSRRLDYEEYTFYHSIGCSRLSTQVIHVLRRLVSGLIAHFDIKEKMNTDDKSLSWVLPRLLERCSKKGRVTIILDGLSNICSVDIEDIGLKFLPLSLPSNGNVRMILSTTIPTNPTANDTEYTLSRNTRAKQILDEITRRKWQTIPLQPLPTSEVVNFTERYLSLSSTNLHPSIRAQVIDTVSTHPLATNVAFITLMLAGICHAVSSGYKSVNNCLVAFNVDSTKELIENMLTLFEDSVSLLGESLCLLFVARHGLHETELFDLLERVQQQADFSSATKGTAIPVKVKIVKLLAEKKNRLIDVFRSFDCDKSGELSYNEFYKGMEKLDINASKEEVRLLIEEVDSNGDGEIDYQETLDHFERMARTYTHGKRRVSVFVHNVSVGNDSSTPLNDTQKENLLQTLKCVGVSSLDSEETGCVLNIPHGNNLLRDAVWSKYIGDESEAESRNFVIDYFSKQQPSLRYCEELPWHLKKCKRFSELKEVLVGLPTLDIMFNCTSLKAELFNYLYCLTSSSTQIKFDIVKEYNKSLQRWIELSSPSAKHTSLMTRFISEVLLWFDQGMVSLGVDLPAFLRGRVPDEYLETLDTTQNNAIGSRANSIGQEEAQYFFNRWLWIQFPYLALQSKNYETKPQPKIKQKPTTPIPIRSQPAEDQSLSVRDNAMIQTLNQPSVALTKLDKLESKPRKRNPTAIPFSSGTTWESNIERDATADSDQDTNRTAVNQLHELKSLHDKLTIEANTKERQHIEQANSQQLKQLGDGNRNKRISDGVEAVDALQSRFDQLNDLWKVRFYRVNACVQYNVSATGSDTATNIDLHYQDILLQLHSCAKQSQHLQLRSQIVLSKQQIVDLSSENDSILKQTELIQDKAKHISQNVQETTHERSSIKPLLESLRLRANEEAERKKTTRVASFDPASFSRRARIEGKIARRRENKLKKPTWSNTTAIEAGIKAPETLHPIKKLIEVTGTQDPTTSIIEMLDESETDQLRVRQEQGEAQVKQQLAKLESLGSQIKVIRLSGSKADVKTDSEVQDNIKTLETVLSTKQKRFESTSELILSLSLAILNLNDKVSSIEDDDSLNKFAQFTMEAAEHTKLCQDVKQLVQSIKSLHDEIPSSEMSLLAKKKRESNDNDTEQTTTSPSSSKYQNIRVLNRDEREEKQQHKYEDDEDCDGYEQSTEDEYGKLASYIDQGINTKDSQDEQRRANLLSNTLLSSKGTILGAVLKQQRLQSASSSTTRNESP